MLRGARLVDPDLRAPHRVIFEHEAADRSGQRLDELERRAGRESLNPLFDLGVIDRIGEFVAPGRFCQVGFELDVDRDALSPFPFRRVTADDRIDPQAADENPVHKKSVIR